MLPIKDVAASADIVFLLIFLFVNAAAIKIRVERGDELDYSFLINMDIPRKPYCMGNNRPLDCSRLAPLCSLWEERRKKRI